jgi:hypothetical protein
MTWASPPLVSSAIISESSDHHYIQDGRLYKKIDISSNVQNNKNTAYFANTTHIITAISLYKYFRLFITESIKPV